MTDHQRTNILFIIVGVLLISILAICAIQTSVKEGYELFSVIQILTIVSIFSLILFFIKEREIKKIKDLNAEKNQSLILKLISFLMLTTLSFALIDIIENSISLFFNQTKTSSPNLFLFLTIFISVFYSKKALSEKDKKNYGKYLVIGLSVFAFQLTSFMQFWTKLKPPEIDHFIIFLCFSFILAYLTSLSAICLFNSSSSRLN